MPKLTYGYVNYGTSGNWKVVDSFTMAINKACSGAVVYQRPAKVIVVRNSIAIREYIYEYGQWYRTNINPYPVYQSWDPAGGGDLYIKQEYANIFNADASIPTMNLIDANTQTWLSYFNGV